MNDIEKTNEDALTVYLADMQIELTEVEKSFILTYYHTNSLQLTKTYMDVGLEEVINLYKDPKLQNILRWMKLEKHREIFKRKMFSLEELGSYLTNQLLELDVAEADKLSPREKLEASKLLVDLHKTINLSFDQPQILNSYETLDAQFKELSVATIKTLLVTAQNKDQKTVDASDLVINKNDEALISELSKVNNLELAEAEKEKMKKVKEKLKMKKGEKNE